MKIKKETKEAIKEWLLKMEDVGVNVFVDSQITPLPEDFNVSEVYSYGVLYSDRLKVKCYLETEDGVYILLPEDFCKTKASSNEDGSWNHCAVWDKPAIIKTIVKNQYPVYPYDAKILVITHKSYLCEGEPSQRWISVKKYNIENLHNEREKLKQQKEEKYSIL